MAPKSAQPRELTWTSVLLAVLVGAVLNVGICYAGLQIGFTIVGSTVAAVIGFGLLRGVVRGVFRNGAGTILEVNIFQTVASSVNTVNAGIIFTVPVLFLLGLQDRIDWPAMIMATTAGSLMGVALIIPLRKQIIDLERLRFPEGVAVAAILRAPGAGMEKSALLVTGIVLSAAVATLTHVTRQVDGQSVPILAESINLGALLGLPAAFRLVFATSLLSIGAGYLAGRHGLAILYGTLLNFWFLIPLCILLGWVPAGFEDFDLASTDYEVANGFAARFAKFTSRHIGIGMILGGAVAGILIALPALKSAIASLKRQPGDEKAALDEMPLSVVNAGLIVGFVLIMIATKLAGGEAVGFGKAALVAVVGSLWLWLAGLVVAQTTGRTDWSPLSGLALIAIAILMGILGTSEAMIVPAVTIGAAICVATSMCADMMADLKTGYLVGSRPIKQQVAQLATCWIGPSVALAAVLVLWKANAFGPDQAQIVYDRQVAAGTIDAYVASGGSPEKLASGIPTLGAPQAGALKEAIAIVQNGDVPIEKLLAGAGLGLVVSILVSPGLGVMVGLSLYLPFEYMIVFGLGGVISILVSRLKGARWAEDKGVPLAAGLIVGDALVGIVHAVSKVLDSAGAP